MFRTIFKKIRGLSTHGKKRIHIFSIWKSILLSTPLFFFFLTPSYAMDITLKWNASFGASGYKIYYKTACSGPPYSGPPYSGTGALEGDSPIDVGNETEFTINDLPDSDYRFALTAYNDSGESGYSLELSTDPTPPSIFNFTIIDFNNDTIYIAYTESIIRGATTEGNYSFSRTPLKFRTTYLQNDDITNPSGNSYCLAMASVPVHRIFELRVSGVTDGACNTVSSDSPIFISVNDSDNDGMADDWESDHGVYNPTADPDGDRLTNFQEFQNGTNPHNPDTDDDGMPDGWEVDNGLEPTFNDSDGDEDGDGLTNYEEFIYILISILKFFDSLN